MGEGGIAGLRRAAVVGTGTVGASWAALFMAHGVDVVATDPGAGAEAKLRAFVGPALGQLRAMGCAGEGSLAFAATAAEAVDGADLVQESAPEDLALKRRLLAEIDRLAPPEALVASSTSALLRSAIVADSATAGRIVVAHPFNPPHLVPLVEIVAADGATAARAASLYRALGRRPVVLRREMEGHIANRLASALYREAVNLVAEGVAGVAEIDAALCHGPGLRWALMGPHMAYHLGGGEGGIRHYLAHLGPSQARRWASLGAPDFTPEVQARIVAGIAEESAGLGVAALAERRDRGLIAVLATRTVVAPEDRVVAPEERVVAPEEPGAVAGGDAT